MKTLGIIDWYNCKCGYGVVIGINDKKYFIHKSSFSNDPKQIPTENDLILFIPSYDEKRKRETGNDILFFDHIEEGVNWAINRWERQENNIFDNDILKVITAFLLYSNKHCTQTSFEDSHFFLYLLHRVYGHIEKADEPSRLYNLIKESIYKVFNKQESYHLCEVIDVYMIDHLPSYLYPFILDNTDSSYVCFLLASKENDNILYINEAIMKAKSKNDLLDALLKMIIATNDNHNIEELKKDKSNITNKCFWNKINNNEIVSEVYDYILPLNIIELKELYKAGYIHDIEEFSTYYSDEEKYKLWKEEIIKTPPISYLCNYILGAEESEYEYLLNLYKKNILSYEIVNRILWDVLDKNQNVSNHLSFCKILYCIKYLININETNVKSILDKGNNHYNFILWFLLGVEKNDLKGFTFETLSQLYIYFNPLDQVNIIKRIFNLAENKRIELNIQKLNSILRFDANLYNMVTEIHPDIPIDISAEIVINSLLHFEKKGFFPYSKDLINIVIRQLDTNRTVYIGHFFDMCLGRKSKSHIILSYGDIEISDSFIYLKLSQNIDDNLSREIQEEIRDLKGQQYGSNKCWKIPLDEKDKVQEIAHKYRLKIINGDNHHLRKYILKNNNKTLPYCEGRQSHTKDNDLNIDFLWCTNQPCFRNYISEHEDWREYTLLDFCRILGFNTDSYDSHGRYIKYGKYLSFISIMNRIKALINHLHCRECGKSLKPIIGNYGSSLVTRFFCNNQSCNQYHNNIYINFCFNWKCHGIIDSRDTRMCPNGWYICPDCGSCCSDNIIQQRIDVLSKNNLPIPLSLKRQLGKGHVEKHLYYCYKCGQETKQTGENEYSCDKCDDVKYTNIL